MSAWSVCSSSSLQKKKGKKRGDGGGEMGGASGGGTDASTSSPAITSKVTSKNLQQLLHKLSVDEKNKPHQFWDTQPVPKLGEVASPHSRAACPLVYIDL